MLTREQAATLQPGEWLLVEIETEGADGDDIERTYPAGSVGAVVKVETLPAPQGLAVHVAIGEIINVFDENDDGGRYPFVRRLRTAAEMAAAVANVFRYDAALNAQEIAPNGDDYNALIELIAGAAYRRPHVRGR